eukprot:GABV01002086.1.p1 GENE.GABV01002086.1~~GABV01002086.1.p1  ORF type:complete len:100 (+),score=45.35 GABV01002086.1:56-355(+)
MSSAAAAAAAAAAVSSSSSHATNGVRQPSSSTHSDQKDESEVLGAVMKYLATRGFTEALNSLKTDPRAIEAGTAVASVDDSAFEQMLSGALNPVNLVKN